MFGDEVVHHFGEGVGELFWGGGLVFVMIFGWGVADAGEGAGDAALDAAVACGVDLLGVGDDGCEG